MRLLLLIPLPGHGDAYTLTECNTDGNFGIVRNQQPILTCTGLGSSENISWSIRNSSSGEEMRIGTCGDCKVSRGCSGCSPLVEGYNISRDSNDSTTLQFLNHSLVTSGSTIKCSNRRNKFNATCTLFVVPALDLNQERATGLPVAAVAGSVVGFVVIVAIAIFTVVILKRRRSKREATGERRDTMPLEGEFEEHINELYQRADDPALPRHSPQNSLAPLSLANPAVDPQGPGSDGAQNHVYAQVNKGKKEKPEDNKEKPGKAHDVKQLTKGGQTQKHADTGDKGGPSPEEQGAVYTECVFDNKEDNSVTNVYMNVDESPPLRPDQDTQAAKKDSGNEDLHDPDLNPYHNTETTQHQGDYTNVQLELNDGEGVMTTAETDDEYRHLQLARPEQLDEHPTYNHLAGV
ncbi:uncharacterized protein [Littorina saxatilis]|uniref:uncharacterized protein n=1 Tax=Littorina saxatilis TaxID=31220 RepID=UPI0038B5D780